MSYPAVCRYRVIFKNNTVLFPNIPGSIDVWALANKYAKEHGTEVISIKRLL